MIERPTNRELLFKPNLSINGTITPDTVIFALRRLADIRAIEKVLIVEIKTDGGDADASRRIALEIKLHRRHSGQDVFCVGKSNVDSAGVTILAAIPAQNPFLTSDAITLIHERRLDSALLAGTILTEELKPKAASNAAPGTTMRLTKERSLCLAISINGPMPGA